MRHWAGTPIRPGAGIVPAVALIEPKYGHNASGALRSCAAFDIPQLWLTGQRVQTEWSARGRLPREERMKNYSRVQVCFGDYFLDAYPAGTVTPVCVEIRESAEPLAWFEHPEDALYIFGPEDGSIPKAIRVRCHRFLILPTNHCINLASAVTWVLGDRRVKRQLAGLEPVLPSSATLSEHRGWHDGDEELA